MKIKITTLALTALLIVGCNGNKKESSESLKENLDNKTEETTPEKDMTSNSSETVTLENTKWLITTLDGGDMSDREKNGQEIYFILDSKTKRISGNSGCNTFTGTYILEEGNRISFSKLGSTKMLCSDSKINESQILSVFESADNYSVTNGKLKLKTTEETLAEFKVVPLSDAAIVEKYWKLKTLNGKTISMTKNQEHEVHFILKTNDNSVKGFAGCNTFGGQYTLEDNNRIDLSDMVTTLKICEDVDFNEAEFLKIFELADNYTITDDVLSLNVGRRAPLAIFEAVYFQ